MTTVDPRREASTTTPLVSDQFDDRRRRGSVLGSRTGAGAGAERRGRDVEKVIGVDHGALRIGTTVVPGWAREGVAYGPHPTRPGRAFAIHLLNGHNTSESYVIDGFARRVARWGLGSETGALWRRLAAYPLSRPRESLPRKLHYWWANRPSVERPLQLDNLAVGWFGDEVPTDPVGSGSGFVVHATGPYNGELRTTVEGRPVAQFRGLQNLPVHYVSVQREQGSVHYAASAYENAMGLPAYPSLRPLAIDRRPLPASVHAGVWQAAQGQIGFSCDSRVYDVTLADVGEFADWATSAVFADRLAVVGPLAGRADERAAASWEVSGPPMVVDQWGAGAAEGAGRATATLDVGAPIGLLHVLVERVASGPADTGRAGLTWRHRGPEDHLRVLVGPRSATFEVVVAGEVVRSRDEPLAAGAGLEGVHSLHGLQVSDDGRALVISLDGITLFDGPIEEEALADATGAGIVLEGGTVRARDVEGHPRTITVPAVLRQRSRSIPVGDLVVLDERFGEPVADLDGRPAGTFRWERLMGDGHFGVVEPGVARFDATVERPVPNRTAYVVDWADPDHCDIEIEAATQAGHEGHRLRIGLIIWQDPANYVAMNAYLDHAYPAASASTFFVFRGFEDIYDAVWSNLGDKIGWDRPFRLRLVSDGLGYLVLVGDEPVLHRAFSDVHPATERLRLAKVGLVANWEWGHDTGSTITRFVGRARS